jgi:hypothetical protein
MKLRKLTAFILVAHESSAGFGQTTQPIKIEPGEVTRDTRGGCTVSWCCVTTIAKP